MATDVCLELESCFLPPEERVIWEDGKVREVSLGTTDKVGHVVKNIFRFSFYALALPFASVFSLGRYCVNWFKDEKKVEPEAKVVEGPAKASALPDLRGCATSAYQDSGLGTKATATKTSGNPQCDWDKHLTPENIENTEDKDYKRFFFDILGNPDAYIQILKEQNVNAHRFSLEWSIIETKEGKIDMNNVQLYRNFIRKLKEAGIEPCVTLHHFVCPEWFKEQGGFEKIENVEKFTKHALHMMELFPEVKIWMPFNEINVDGFQKKCRGVYPPGDVGDIAGAGKMMRNMLIAHCQIYKQAKAKWGDAKQIGSSHQWLKFEPMSGNPIEKAFCYFLSKITHYACFDFFKTGNFSLEIPGKANVQMRIDPKEFKENNGFSDFIGVQFYGLPRLKLGFNGGKEHPGYKIKNYLLSSLGLGLTFGSTCPEGGIAQSFGPSFYPESLDKCLTEAEELKKPIFITETGCDARVQKWGEKEWTVDYEVQKSYYERIFPILEKHKEHIKAFFAWTLAKGLEWERGDTPILQIGEMITGKDRQILGYQPYPAAEFLKAKFGEIAEQERVEALLRSA